MSLSVRLSLRWALISVRAVINQDMSLDAQTKLVLRREQQSNVIVARERKFGTTVQGGLEGY